MITKPTKRQNTVSKALFKFKDIEIRYNLPNTADVYYLTDNNEYNKEVNQLLLDFGYKRLGLYKSEGLIELQLGIEYKRHGRYWRDDGEYMRDNDKREQIRSVPFIT